MSNPSPYPLAAAVMVDKALAAVNARLMSGGLAWLSAAYGQAQRLSGERGGQAYQYPAVYTGGQGKGDYLDLLPDAHLAKLGGYSFWDIAEPVTARGWRGSPARLEIRASLVVWFDFRLVYPADWQGRSVWNVVQAVLDVLRAGTGQAAFADDLNFSYSAETVYPRYSHREIERQFLMRPYGGFRIEGTLYFNQAC